jgi:hypothetical protein
MLNRESCQKSEKDFCFATLALGKKYRYLALLLAEDLEKYSPNTSFVILTDNPREFSVRSNVRGLSVGTIKGLFLLKHTGVTTTPVNLCSWILSNQIC